MKTPNKPSLLKDLFTISQEGYPPAFKPAFILMVGWFIGYFLPSFISTLLGFILVVYLTYILYITSGDRNEI